MRQTIKLPLYDAFNQERHLGYITLEIDRATHERILATVPCQIAFAANLRDGCLVSAALVKTPATKCSDIVAEGYHNLDPE